MASVDLASLLTPPPGAELRYAQGTVVSWDTGSFSNVITWAGTQLEDVPVVSDINALTIQELDVVGMLGWSTPGGVSSWWVIGKIVPPGEDASSMVIQGGEIVLAGGNLRMTSQDGSTGLLYFGTVSDGSRSWLFSHEDGEIAGGLLGSLGSKYWGWLDRNGNQVLSNDAASGVGLARPYIPYRIVPSFSAEGVGEGSVSLWPSTTSTTAVKLMQGINSVQHPRVSIGVETTTIGGGAVAWRLDIGGQTAASGTGGGSQTVAVPGWGDTIDFGDSAGFDLYAWATGGATRAWIQCDRLYGLRS